MQGVEQCVALLGEPSDEKRFVGLLLATRLVKQPGDLSRIFDAGIQFVRRLLLSPAPAESLEGNPYQSLALAVLASFAMEPSIHSRPEFLACTAAAAAPFANGSAMFTAELADSAAVLRVALQHPMGISETVRARLASKTFAVAVASPAPASSSPSGPALAPAPSLAPTATALGSAPPAPCEVADAQSMNSGDLACDLLELLAAASQSLADVADSPAEALAEELLNAATIIAPSLASQRDSRSFRRLHVLLTILGAVRACRVPLSAVIPLSRALFAGLGPLLSSRLPAAIRAELLQVLTYRQCAIANP